MLFAANYTAISARLRSPRKRTREAAALTAWMLAALEKDVADEKRRDDVRRYWVEG